MRALGVAVKIIPAARRGTWDPSRVRLSADLDYMRPHPDDLGEGESTGPRNREKVTA
jgi:hypothetical protein